jgi:aspartokinase-like uncharacterized kinase
MKPQSTWVIKLGGSLFNAQHLRGWLHALATHADGGIVVVPGGGPFADQVRTAQQRWRFDHATAHRMAMLGMAQYGLMLTGLQPRLAPASSAADVLDAHEQGRVAVWIPTACEPLDLPRDWSVTSDSVAAWLAGRLQASELVLIKALRFSTAKIEAGELARRGIIDEALPGLLTRACYCCRIISGEDSALLAAMLHDNKHVVGTLVTAQYDKP